MLTDLSEEPAAPAAPDSRPVPGEASDDVTGAPLFFDGGMTLYPGFPTGG